MSIETQIRIRREIYNENGKELREMINDLFIKILSKIS